MSWNPYWKLFAIPGAAGFSAAAFLGRLPAGMIGLAIILPISKLMGSYTLAGVVSASTMAGMALCAPLSGRLVDRVGQSRPLLIFAVLNFIGTSALIACVQFGAPLETLCIAGAITGASRLSTGTIARTRWAYVTRVLDSAQRVKTLRAAYAFESIVDEGVFICAPILATLLCTAIHPLAGLVCCLVSYGVGAVTLAVQSSTEPAIEAVDERQSSALTVPGLRVIFAAILCIGLSAGAIEVIVVAVADDAGSRPLAGLLMATLAFSSMLAGFWYGARLFRPSAHILWIRCLGLLVLALVPFAFATNPAALALALFVAGLAIAPTSIAGQLLTERMLPARLLNEGMSIVVTAMILGMAAGSWLSGILIDMFGAHRAGALPAMATLAALVIAIVCARSLIVPLKPSAAAIGQEGYASICEMDEKL